MIRCRPGQLSAGAQAEGAGPAAAGAAVVAVGCVLGDEPAGRVG